MKPLLPLLITTLSLCIMTVGYVLLSLLVRRSFFARVVQIRRILPGLDCGACGYPECIDFAEAVADGRVEATACIPGGPKTAHAIADLCGTTAQTGEPFMAVVHCKGGTREVRNRARYEGIHDCHAAILLGNGTKECPEGCLGFGSCVAVCPVGALSINDNGIAIVNRHLCTGCGACVSECPRNLISLVPHVHKIFLACNNHESGERVTSYCSVGCTACGACIAITPSGAISMENNLPRLDYFTPNENFVAAVYICPSRCFTDTIKARPKANIDTKCDGCGACVAVCPVSGAIVGRAGQRHVIKKELCIGCGRCLGSCHVRAISLWGSLGYETGLKSKAQR
ncbi:MAG: 4Fe-4S binding protein [Chitinispirillaceae bacterium]|nr:4Fe-4S binding protein [Chitinispirillaceae bacterium]